VKVGQYSKEARQVVEFFFPTCQVRVVYETAFLCQIVVKSLDSFFWQCPLIRLPGMGLIAGY